MAEFRQTSQAQDVAASVFNSINLLAIKRSVRLLVDLDTGVIEDFVKKYSAVVIFLLNVLDSDRSAHLLSRLTDASVLYLIEEELRFLVIKEIAHCGPDVTRLMELTAYMEALDAPKTHKLGTEDARRVVSLLAEARAGRKTTSLAYIEALDLERRKAVFSLILRENPLALLGFLAFAADHVAAEAFDEIALGQPEALEAVPETLFLRRLHLEHALLQKTSLRGSLPSGMRAVLDRLDAARQHFEARIGRVAGASRRERIEVAHELLNAAPADQRPILLGDLERTGAVDSEAIVLLRAAIRKG